MGRVRSALESGLYALVTLAGCGAAGYVFVFVAAPISRAGMLPWLVGRSLGLAAYVSLTASPRIGSVDPPSGTIPLAGASPRGSAARACPRSAPRRFSSSCCT